ncbi:MAG: V-type ATPase subunit [Synergistaceae bacterium]|jgi:V/A-type H+-transporting ATPase subunit C|nr:V-type ATPase subunit [Synergistaceae bacterium]
MAVGVKAHVLYSRLLSADDYWNLLSSDTVTEIGQKLRDTSYGDALETMPREPHRHDLEAAVKNTLVAQAENFLFHISSPRDKFFKALLYRQESDNLKSIFRYMASGRANRDELRRRLYISKQSRISYDNVLSARDFMELADALRNTQYYKVLAEPLRRLHTGEEHSLFPLEMALDISIELAQYKALKKLERAERDRLLPIFGVRADLFNLYLLYRAMEFYDMTPEETLNRLLPVRFRVTMPILREFARAESGVAIADMLKNRFPQYAELFASALDDEYPDLSMERNIKRYLYLQAARVFGGGPPGFHTAVSYYVLKEFEIADIIRIIEYVRYAHDRRDAAEYLTRPITAAGGESEWQ